MSKKDSWLYFFFSFCKAGCKNLCCKCVVYKKTGIQMRHKLQLLLLVIPSNCAKWLQSHYSAGVAPHPTERTETQKYLFIVKNLKEQGKSSSPRDQEGNSFLVSKGQKLSFVLICSKALVFLLLCSLPTGREEVQLSTSSDKATVLYILLSVLQVNRGFAPGVVLRKFLQEHVALKDC